MMGLTEIARMAGIRVAPNQILLPEGVRDHHHGVRARLAVLLREEGSAERRADAEQIEVVPGDEQGEAADRLAGAGLQAHRAKL